MQTYGGRGVTRRGLDMASQKPRCTACNRVKVKCSEFLPCARCFRLCLPCVPASTDSTYPELAVSMLSIADANKTFMRVFEGMQSAGLLDRGYIQTLASAWHAESLRAGTDVTQGLLHKVARSTKLSAAELTSHVVDIGPVHSGCATNGRSVDGGSVKRGDKRPRLVSAPMPLCCIGGILGLTVGRELKGVKVEEVDGIGASQEAISRARLRACAGVRGLDDGSRMVVTVATTRNGLLVATNSVADHLLCSATEMTSLMHQHRVLPMHVMASMILSEERHLLYEAQVSVLFSQPRPHTAFLKLCERDGQIELYILQARAMELPELPEACGPATVYTLERCPASKHLSTRPGHRHRVIERHRQGPEAVIRGEQSAAGTRISDKSVLDRAHITAPASAYLPWPPPVANVPHRLDPSRCDYPCTPLLTPISAQLHVQSCLDKQRNGTASAAVLLAAGSSCYVPDSEVPALIPSGISGIAGESLPCEHASGTQGYPGGDGLE